MSYSASQYLFSLRLWWERTGPDDQEIRGHVRHLTCGESI